MSIHVLFTGIEITQGAEQDPVDDGQFERAMHAVTLSFAADPIMRWMVPEPKDYVATMPKIFDAFARKSIRSNSFFCLDEERAVALWLPAGVEPDSEIMTAALREVVAPDLYDDIGAVFPVGDAVAVVWDLLDLSQFVDDAENRVGGRNLDDWSVGKHLPHLYLQVFPGPVAP